MTQTAASLADHIIPPVPVRQWVISVPKRLRGFLADRGTLVTAYAVVFTSHWPAAFTTMLSLDATLAAALLVGSVMTANYPAWSPRTLLWLQVFWSHCRGG